MGSSGTRSSRLDGAMYRRGDQLSRYVIIGTLGRGSMGVVYTAYDPDLARTVAVKVVRHRTLDKSGLPGLRARLLREAQGLAQLSHPNVVSIYDAGTDGGEFYIAMELIDGVSLRRWMVREQPAVDDVVRIFACCARGLAAAHRRGLVHRDFKPENVLVADDGRVLVSDFGLVRPHGDTPEPDSRTPGPMSMSVDLTRDGDLVGTPAYMAPEQLAGAPASPRTDQYALCSALFEALYGRRPFGGRAPTSSLRRAKQRGLRTPLPSEARRMVLGGLERGATGPVPQWLRMVVERGLEPGPSQRYASMDVIADILDRTPVRRRRRRQLLASAGAFAAVAAGVGALGLHRAAQSPCAGAGVPQSSAWSDEARADIVEAFADAGSVPADGVLDALERYVDDWGRAHRQVCQATWVDREQPAELLDARMTCLREQWRDVGATISLLRQADHDVVRHSARLVEALSPADRCLELDVRPAFARPEDPGLRARWERALDGIARVEALREAGKIHQATRALDVLGPSLEHVGDPALMARATTQRGLLELEGGMNRPARATLRRALRLARRTEQPELEAEIWLGLAQLADRDREGPPPDFAARMAVAAATEAGTRRRIQGRAARWLSER